MNDVNIVIKRINILGSKANELMNSNKILTNEISYYQKLFISNKNYITSYFNILAENKKKSKNNNNNAIANNNNNNTNNQKNSHINKIKELMIKYHSEIKDINITSKKSLKTAEQKNNAFLLKLNTETKSISEYYEKLSEDNFLYVNAVKAKDNYISCLKKDLLGIKNKIIEEKKHIYLKYNYQNIYTSYKTTVTQNSTSNKNDLSFEDGENEIKDLLLEARRRFIYSMKSRSNIRLKYNKMNVKKHALNDLVTSISFINKTDIIPSKSNNIFEMLNKKIGGVIKNYEKYYDDNEKIDENFFIFLPFEIEINKDEISELVQTDITLPNKKLQSKSINEYKKSSKKVTKNRSFIDVPKLNFLQIEFNKEKISYTDSESEKNSENKNTKSKKENNNNNKEKEKDNDNERLNDNEKDKKEIDNKNKETNTKVNIDLKIKELKKMISQLKKDNRSKKRIINDFENFQKKIKNKFIIFEAMMKNKKGENNVDTNNIDEK